MSNPTTPFNWQMPTNTDLVTDLPADFEVFGQAVATSMADLLGGTTGQILSKATNADMDFTWIANDQGDITGVTAGTGISGGGTSGTVTVTNSMATAIDAKGDLIGGTGADTFSRLAVGTNGQVLTADSAEATGMKWNTVATGGITLLTTLSPSAVSEVLVDNIFTSTYDNYVIEWCVNQTTNAVGFAQLRSGGTNLAANYTYDFIGIAPSTGQTSWSLSDNTGTGNELAISMKLYNPALAKITMGFSSRMATVDNTSNFAGLVNTNATAYDGIRLAVSGGTMTGKIRIYGLAN
jgi:hypothetical protein